MTKDELRKNMLIIRNKIANKEKISTIIVDKIINLDIYKKSKVIALYNSMNMEVDISCLISELRNKVILLPRVIDNRMIFVEINSNTKYSKSIFGVIEPIGDEYIGNIDLIIVPGVAFDKERNRLGYGKGYYDRYLKNNNIYKIGICFHKQLVSKLPINEHDIKMDLVITEKEFF